MTDSEIDTDNNATAGIRPFRVEVPQEDLEDLGQRLARTRFPDETPDVGWSRGVPTGYLEGLVGYWREGYDWRAWEARFNEHDQFTTTIDGQNVHFLHVRSPEPGALPLIVCHGYPGSVVEFMNVIGPLTDPVAHGGDAADAFHVVVPSLPGYGWSDRPAQTGWNVRRIAAAWEQLMLRLGYDRFAAQGGDWGSMVTLAVGAHHTDHLAGIHVNMPLVIPTTPPEEMTPTETAAVAGLEHYMTWDGGYSAQQSTRPQSLGYGLADSPVGQMAWIVEKFWSWTDCDGDPLNALTADELLDNVMVYWLTNTAASSARLYWESFKHIDFSPIEVPSGISIFPHEIFRCSR